ncbi:class I SAM-dependent methyltransferase [Candidatus Woesearchaeota archaeon]|nr:class I SAM-dependent methyltransferase [Candidatus Woesearchaeota archaeon]
MSKKVIFDTKLNPRTLALRSYVVTRLNKHIDLSSSKLLEVGCGNGRFGVLLAPLCAEYIGIDPDREYLEMARAVVPQTARILEGSAEKIPLDDDSVDVVFYAFSWHFVDHEKALPETRRVLRNDGIVAILEPSTSTTQWADPKLRPGDPEFDEDLYQEKMRQLEKAEAAIDKQLIFDNAVPEYDPHTRFNFWILK